MKTKHRLWQLTVLFIMSLLVISHAADVSKDDIMAASRKWIEDNAVFKLELPNAVPVNATQLTDKDGQLLPLWRVDLAPSGYLVMSSDDTLPPVVAFNTKGSFEKTPAGHPLPDMLKRQGAIFKTELGKPQTRGNELAAENQARWNALLKRTRAESVTPSEIIKAPMLTTEWNQSAPYNYFCPSGSSYAERAVAGCVPVAIAQILKYYEWPLNSESVASYTDNKGNIQASMLAEHEFLIDWSAMQDSYEWKVEQNYGTSEYAVARLIMEIGVMLKADYELDGTAAFINDIEDVLSDHFEYTSKAILNDYPSSLYSGIRYDIKTQGIPVIVSYDGHTFIADGLGTMAGQDYYHFNYGWGGFCNGWYLLTDGYEGTVITSAILDIEPSPDPFIKQISEEQLSTFTLEWEFPKRSTAEAFRLEMADLDTDDGFTEIAELPGTARSYTLTGQSGRRLYTVWAKVDGIWQGVSNTVYVQVKDNPIPMLEATCPDSLKSIAGQPVVFTVTGNHDLGLVAMRSSRPDILPYSGIERTGSGNTRTVTLTPNSDIYGNAIVYLQTCDYAGTGNYVKKAIAWAVMPDEPLTWHTDESEASEAAYESGKLVLMVAGRDTCQNTNYFRNTVCETPDIKARLLSDYVLWYTNVDTSSEYYSYAYDLGGTLPFIAILDPAQQNMRLRGHGGFMSIDEGRLFLDPDIPYFGLDASKRYPNGTEQTLNISVLREGAVIYYRLDSNEPTLSDTLYTDEIPLTETTTVSARAFLNGQPISDTVTKTYTFMDQVATPTLNMAVNAYFYESCLVQASCSTNGAIIRYTTNGLIPTENSPEFPAAGLTVTERMAVVVMAFKDGMIASDYAYTILTPFELFREAQSIVTLGDVTMLQAGNTPWFLQTATYKSSPSAMQSGDIDDNESSVMGARIIGSGTLSFQWKVSSEQSWDKLTFFIDGVEQDNISGETDWAQKEYTIRGAGEHLLTWEYAKDVSVSNNGDCGWLDDVSWTTNPDPDPVVITDIAISTPPSNTIPTGETATYSCLGIRNDGTTTPITPTWTITPTSYASVDANGVVTNNNTTTTDQFVTLNVSYTTDGITRTDTKLIKLEGVPLALVSIEVRGPTFVASAGTATYSCVAIWNDQTTSVVTPVWYLASDVASISDSGVVTNNNTDTTNRQVRLNATYTVGNETLTDTKSITLLGVHVYTQTLTLTHGWNWVSFYVLPPSRKVNDVLGTAGFMANDLIQTNGDSARFTGASWVRENFLVEFGRMYQIYVYRDVTVEVTGETSDVSSVWLTPGWNWVGNPTSSVFWLSQLTHSGGWTANDRIQTVKSGGSTSHAAYGNDGWSNYRSSALEPGLGYQIYSANAGKLTFPSTNDGDASTYIVVDLSGGPDAASYPVRYTNTAPNLNDDTCRTTELWLRRIPAGTFSMGSPEDELGRTAAREAQHQVTLTQDYYIGVFEFTQRQWELVMGTRPSYFHNDTYYATRPVESVSYDLIRGGSATAGAGWPATGHAVDADSFMGILRAKTGLTFDLPTEAQWEYACRAGTTTALNSGKNLTFTLFNPDSAMAEVGRYLYNGGSEYSEDCTSDYGTAKVGSYLPNAWGLYDMHGNVYEWCLDWFQWDLGTSAVTDPVGADTSTDGLRMLRSGYFFLTADGCRSADRWHYQPRYETESIGFRIACDSQSVQEKPDPEKYVVVDLSGGPNVLSYPVRYSATGPDVNDDACRTTELWLRRIPAGTFVMGAPEDEVGYFDEIQHAVVLTQDYYIGVFECTQRQWELVMGDSNPSKYTGDCRPVEQVSYTMIRGSEGWPQNGHNVGPDSFMGVLQAKTGLTFDLPTEAQWEYACRAGTTTALNIGTNLETETLDSNLATAGRYAGNSGSRSDGIGGYDEHTTVGSYLPNDWGLYDMHGNVWEWCLDKNEDYKEGLVVDPVGKDWGSSDRILRGGGFLAPARYNRSAKRISGSASNVRVENGFRIACHPKEEYMYAVVDLAGGPNAESYGVRYTNTPPDLSTSNCRTTELWLRKIPAGTFFMGSHAGEVGRIYSDEEGYQVTLTQDYYIGVFECTQYQWELVMGDKPSYFNNAEYYSTRPVEQVSYDMIRGMSASAGAGWPVAGHAVDLDSFMGKLRQKTGLTFDLPTEAQWEYACRAGTTTALNSGKNLTYGGQDEGDPAMDEVGRYRFNGGGTEADTYEDNIQDCTTEHGTARVGSYLPNAWGLYDMHGNVDEWCLDWLASRYDTTQDTDPVGPATGRMHMIRGGSWPCIAAACRSANRNQHYPSVCTRTIGFRIAIQPKQNLYAVVDMTDMSKSIHPVRYTDVPPDLNDAHCREREIWLRKIPKGTFIMGSPEDELGHYGGETQHEETLTEDYYISVFECTQAQWLHIMFQSGQNTSPSYYKGNARPVESVSYDMIRGISPTAGAGWPEYGHAVDADSFMGRIRAKTGLMFDLPTEAQWEYACRAGTTTALNSGKNLLVETGVDANLNEVGRYDSNLNDGKGGYSEHTKVGSYLPNVWGLYDMHGNVEEWCLDIIGDDHGYHTLRGGSYYNSAEQCRSSSANSCFSAGDNSNFGFRMVFTLP